MLRKFQLGFHFTGSLAANVDIKFTVPSACQLLHSSAVSSNDSDATLKLGTSAAAEAYLEETTIGDSGVPSEKTKADFVGAEYPHIPDDTVFAIAIDFDGASGTAADDLTLVLTFSEG